MAGKGHNSPTPSPASAPAEASGGGLRGLLGWARRRPVLGLGLAALVVVAIIGLGVCAALMFSAPPPKNFEERLAEAFAALDAGQHSEARWQAAELRAEKQLSYEAQAAPMYILGATLAHDAQNYLEPERRKLLFRIAARYLEEARDRGFPEGRAGEGHRLLAICQQNSDRHAQSLPELQAALELLPERKTELERLLAEAYLHLDPPQPGPALTHLQRHLADQELPPRERHAGQVLLARLMGETGDLAGGVAALAEIPENSPLRNEAAVWKARLFWEQARALAAQPDQAAAAADALARAEGEARQLVDRAGVEPAVQAQAHMALGLCLLDQGDAKAAEAQFLRLRRLHFGSPEALAATVFAADLLRRDERIEEALGLYRKALQELSDHPELTNAWLPAEDWRRRMQAAFDELLAAGDYPRALELAAALPPLVPEDHALLLRTQAHAAWAQRLLAEAAEQKPAAADVTRAEAYAQLREAGHQQAQLAQLRWATRHYEDDLWNSASSYLAGHAFREAADMFRAYLKQAQRRRRAEALVGLGDALLSQGEAEAALAVLAQCLEESPRHPSSYRARLLAALANQELGRLAEARQLLNANLYEFSLTPQSLEWRDSLFALGKLLFQQGQELEIRSRLQGADSASEAAHSQALAQLEQSFGLFQEAIGVLSEAVQRFPEAPAALEARYRVAEAHRQSAKWPRKKLGTVTIETTRISLNRQYQEDLARAVDRYSELLESLDREQAAGQLRPLEQALIRNCYFGRADCLFDLGKHDEAIQAYSAATNRYQNEPESLEAYVQIASCYRRTNRMAEARGTLQQARVVLQRIRSDADFARTTRYSRDEWAQLLDWLAAL